LTAIVEYGWRKRAPAEVSEEEGRVGAPVARDVAEEVDMIADVV
jgi:hypothetical protein